MSLNPFATPTVASVLAPLTGIKDKLAAVTAANMVSITEKATMIDTLQADINVLEADNAYADTVMVQISKLLGG